MAFQRPNQKFVRANSGDLLQRSHQNSVSPSVSEDNIKEFVENGWNNLKPNNDKTNSNDNGTATPDPR